MSSKGGVQTITAEDGTVWRKSSDGPHWVRSEDDTFYVLDKMIRCLEKGIEDTGWYMMADYDHPDSRQWCATLLLDAVDVATDLISEGRR